RVALLHRNDHAAGGGGAGRVTGDGRAALGLCQGLAPRGVASLRIVVLVWASGHLAAPGRTEVVAGTRREDRAWCRIIPIFYCLCWRKKSCPPPCAAPASR